MEQDRWSHEAGLTGFRAGPLADKWRKHKTEIKLVNPANKRKYEIIVVGAGLAGASAAATLAELGYKVKNFVFHDSPRRARTPSPRRAASTPRRITRTTATACTGCSTTRSRAATTARARPTSTGSPEVSVNIIDQCVAQGVPFAREYGGLLANRSFGGAQVSRTFYARGQTGQQLLLGAYSALSRMVGAGGVELHTNSEMLDLVVVDGHAKGIIVRDLITGEITRHAADAVVLATGGYGNVFNLSTYARGSNATAIWRAYKRGACFANPCYTQIHPTCIPVSGDYQSKLTLMSESLRNDGRIWVPKKKEDAKRKPNRIPEADRDYYLERMYPELRQPRAARHRLARRQARVRRGPRRGRDRPRRLSRFCRRHQAPRRRTACASATATSSTSTTRSPPRSATKTPMRIYPAVHYTMGGLWVDYNLMSNVPGLFVLGEANFSDHGANRLGASALMQGLADGYFVIPYTIGDYLAGQKPGSRPSADAPEFKAAEENVRAR